MTRSRKLLSGGVWALVIGAMCFLAELQLPHLSGFFQLAICLGLVAAGLGLAILPDSVRSLSRVGVAFVPIRAPQHSTMIGAFRADDDNLLLRAFLDAAKDAPEQPGSPAISGRSRPRARR